MIDMRHLAHTLKYRKYKYRKAVEAIICHCSAYATPAEFSSTSTCVEIR